MSAGNRPMRLLVFVFFALFAKGAYGQASTWCRFLSGPLTGQVLNYAPRPPLPIGSGCQDGPSIGQIVLPPASVAALNPFAAVDAQLKNQHFNGVLYVSRGGTVVFNRSYGFSNPQMQIPNNGQSIFLIGSLTKHFTAAGILVLQQQNLLQVTDNICIYLAPCPPQWNGITIQELLTHSSGIVNYTELPQVQSIGMTPVTPAQLLALVAPIPLRFLPGSKFEYSNSNYAILGAIIEHITNEDYSTFMDNTFFTPFQLHHTSYTPGKPIATVGTGGVGFDNRFVAYSAGGLSSSAEDIGSWIEGLAFGNMLQPASKNMMFTQSIAAPTMCRGGGYGFGWCIGPLPNGSQAYFHDGDIPGFESAITVVPGKHLVVVALSNVAGSPVLNLTQSVADLLSK